MTDGLEIADDADHDLVVQLARLHTEPDRPGKQADLHALLAEADERDLVNAAVFGRLCLALVQFKAHDLAAGAANFAWCEQRWSERAAELGGITIELLLALYGLLINNAREEPRVPFRQISEFVDAFALRTRQYGRSMCGPHMHAFLAAFSRGDDADCDVTFRRWQAEARPADEPPQQPVAMLWPARRHDWDAVLALYRQGLAEADGHEWMGEYLHAGALEALVQLGRLNEAAQVQQRAYAAIDRDDPGLEPMAYQLNYCRLTDRLDLGLTLLVESLPWLAANRSPGLRIDYAQHAAALLLRLRLRGRGREQVLDGRTIDDVASELSAEADAYAAIVDRVNATTVGTDRLRRFRAEHA